ncbi:MAG: FAD-dependent oxidoreductase [Eubacteriales bacterium]|nr:FAD-dependent oxidoreductase [Eubacteriales bacterium]
MKKHEKYPKLFEPITIRRMTVKNRVSMAPMGTNYGEQNGEMSFLHMDYYEQRAQGGAGMIIVENACVDFPLGSNGTTQIRIDHDNYIPRFYKLCETVHQYGTCIAVQLNHAGASAMDKRIGMQTVSASDVPSKPGGSVPRPLTKEEILEIVKKYGEAAKRAQAAGFDAVEVHAGHGYLISQFLSPTMNKRTDEFGGSPENRARFAKMVMEEVRKQVGPFFPIFCRISADELVKGGNTLEDTLELLTYFEKEADVIDVSAGLNSSLQYQIDSCQLEDGWRSYMSRAVKEKFGKPTITTGNIRSPKRAEEILENGDADFIGMGRGLIADPNWVNKVEFGEECSIRKCISCNIGCAGHRLAQNTPIRCTVNPTVNEWSTQEKVSKPCNVVVIGGGTAGLEAACTAAEAGCQTFLLEKKEELGGLAAQISKIPDKKRIHDFVDYLTVRAENLPNLYTFTGTEATAKFVKCLKPNIIVNATGSQPLLPPIKGLYDWIDKEGSKVYSILKMIDNIDRFPQNLEGKTVTVVGGGAVGLDVVEFFAPRGANVTIIEMMDQIGKDLDPVSKLRMKEIIEKYNVTELPKTALTTVSKDSFTVKTPEGELKEYVFDYGFVCLGMKSRSPVLEELEEVFAAEEKVEIMNVGDSVRARRIIEGIAEGHNILKTLRKHGYLSNR